jgi:ADP-heptose:LPS heptosyltransferase
MTAAEQRIPQMTGRVPQRIAVVRALHLGDLLLAVPALRGLRAGYPDAEITLIGLPWAETFASRFSAYLDRFLPFPGYPGIDEVTLDRARTQDFLEQQRAYGYDLVIQMHGSGRTSNPFALDLGGSLTAGHVPSREQPTHRLDFAAPYPDDLHEIDRNLRLVSMLACPVSDRSLEFPLSAADRAEAEALLATTNDHRPLIGIHPGAKHPSRRWEPARFAAVADALTLRYDARIAITGGPDEVDVAWDVARTMRFMATVLAGQSTIGGLAALIDRLDLFVSNDTGPAHIASALGTPAVVVFGPADLRRWEPVGAKTTVIARDVTCRPCGQAICPIDHRCLAWIDPEEVVAAASELLGARRQSATLPDRHAVEPSAK